MTAGEKFEVIDRTLEAADNMMNVKLLCEIGGVSRSGYYNWKANAPKRAAAEERDRADFELILKAYNQRGYAKGARSICMTMLHWDPPVVMNLKKIRRLMNKYGLKCPVRKPNPYRRMARAMKTDRTAKNVLNREFTEHGARKVLLTDITYLPYNGTFAYLSTILDAYTRQVLGYALSDSMELDFVLETVRKVMKVHGMTMTTETLIHSDQGCHYTSVRFGELVRNKNLRQSMSRKGCCWDNAPQESFFGHMKDEIDLTNCTTFSQVRGIVDDWMSYYNTERYQWQLAKLAPDEYYEYITTGVYPLQGIVEPKDRNKTQEAERTAKEETERTQENGMLENHMNTRM